MKRWVINILDTIDIWIITHFNLRPKQRILEYKMDHYPDPYVEKMIQEALQQNEKETNTRV